MASATATKSTGDPIMDMCESLKSQQRELIGEMAKSRRPNYRQPVQTVAKYAPKAEGANGGFESVGQFLACVKACAFGGWQSNDLMKRYVNGPGFDVRKACRPA